MRGVLSHASFFSGVGGTDLGLERAGFRTVSFSEVDPYACAVLAERWPDVPNLGDITDLASAEPENGDLHDAAKDADRPARASGLEWTSAVLWSGGFPCQDLSVAGKRAGFTGERSVLAFAFLALVERHRPPAILLENVPGLLSSNSGRDMARLIGEMAELGYGVAYRILDAQFFGVPQRRRRVFILGLRSDPDDAGGRVAAERAAAVLSVGTRCERHPATGHRAGARVASGAGHGVAAAGAVSTRTIGAATGHHGYTIGAQDADGGYLQLSPSPDASGNGTTDGLAGRPHDQHDMEAPWVTSGPEMIDGSGPTVTQSLPTQRVGTDDNDAQAGFVQIGPAGGDDPLLPLGLDSHRYRCCGNGVVAPVARWLGQHIYRALTEAA